MSENHGPMCLLEPWEIQRTSPKRQEEEQKPAYFLRDGRFVRVPASDQVRIPKGFRVFLEVDEDNRRIDGAVDRGEGLHGRDSTLFKKVYVPPSFSTRIFLFILSIWLFAAFTGVCITIFPLVFGRMIFATIIPNHLRMNDVYAFSIWIYILESALYGILHLRPFFTLIQTFIMNSTVPPAQFLQKSIHFTIQAATITYFYTATLLILPALLALILEFYLIIPLHTYFSPHEPHVTNIIQSWTLGLLYINPATKYILWHSNSRPAEVLRRLHEMDTCNQTPKFSRVFLLPATILTIVLFCTPLLGATVLLDLKKP